MNSLLHRVCIGSFVTALAALSSIPADAKTLRSPQLLSTWPERDNPGFGGDLDVVSIADPAHRQHCRQVTVAPDSLTCVPKNHSAIAYNRADVLALISPPSHDNFFCIASGAALVAGTVAASFFVPAVWAVITLRIAGGALFFSAWAACGLAADQGFPDHWHDEIVYQKEGTSYSLHRSH